MWEESYRADPIARVVADRHYNRQKIGSPQFVPPGRCLVLAIPHTILPCGAAAFWVTSYPFAQYVRHAWAGAMVCSAFRNERPDLYLSSDLVREAVVLSVKKWIDDIPALGMVTFVDTHKTREKRNPGYCYLKAGFRHVGYTKGGLVALQMTGEKMLAC